MSARRARGGKRSATRAHRAPRTDCGGCGFPVGPTGHSVSAFDETIHACSSCWPALLADFASQGLDLADFADVVHLVLVPEDSSTGRIGVFGPPEPPGPLAPLFGVN